MLGHIKQQSPKSWGIYIDVGKRPDGRRHQKSFTVKGTREDAEEYLRRKLKQLRNGVPLGDRPKTVEAFLEEWLEHVKPTVKWKTYFRYEQFVRKNLVPGIGSIVLERLNARDIDRFKNRLLESGRKDGKGLSAQTVVHILTVLSMALKQAVRWRYIEDNPAEDVRRPKVRQKRFVPPPIEHAFDFADAAKETQLYIPIVLAITAGLRQEEIAGLLWTDLEENQLTIQRAVVPTSDGWEFDETKSEDGWRVVTLPPMTLEALMHHRKEQEHRKGLLGKAYNEHGLICCREDGTLWPPSAISSAYRDFVRRRKLPKLTFHELRHLHGSYLLREGVDIKVISERLGHSRVSFTMQRYVHLMRDADAVAADRLQKAFVRKSR